ncbi:hypothetical protein PRZ48_009290 [Zasmidium cellare]|uniref:BTB domain-containing protein n=1 Tax=Zasmidium cellare TaxID=395010 RepID=A0ABR0ECA2_ZASCE|nr:hypothetical protein PRZ48_009290 [Zasmidium cellare]
MPSYPPTGLDAVTSGLNKLQQGAMPTDFVLESSSGKTWNVHKAVLLMHSDVLFLMATSPNFVESQNGRAVLEDAADRCIDVLVDYMYSLSINLRGCFPRYGVIIDTEVTKSEASFLIGLYRLAHMYNVEAVVHQVLEELVAWFARAGTSIEIIELLLDAGAEFDSVPSELQGRLAMEMARLFDWHPRLDMDKVHSVMQKHPEFAVDVLHETLLKNRNRQQ